MMAFIDQEASEKAEEIDAKVRNVRDNNRKVCKKDFKNLIRPTY